MDSFLLPWILFLYHLLFSLIYWRYSLTNVADSTNYYKNIEMPVSFAVGTDFLKWFLNKLHIIFNASYLDYFILFQLFGFLGFCFLYMTLKELLPKNSTKLLNRIILVFLFLPNLHFWTSAIGKDSLIFGSITLTIWSLLNFHRRIFALIIGLGVTYLVRPHVAGFLLAAIFLALIWGRGLTLRWRLIGTIVVSIVFVIVLPKISKFVGIETLSTESVSDYLYKRQGYNLSGGSSVDIRNYNFPAKVFTFLYRPLFLDARGILWLIVSIENLFYLIITGYSFSPKVWTLLWKYRISFFIRFNLFFFLSGVVIFSLSISNMGIAIRQKTMLIPSLFFLVLSVFVMRQYYSESPTDPIVVEPNSEK